MQQKANTAKDNQKAMPRTVVGSEAPLQVITTNENENNIIKANGLGLIFIYQFY